MMMPPLSHLPLCFHLTEDLSRTNLQSLKAHVISLWLGNRLDDLRNLSTSILILGASRPLKKTERDLCASARISKEVFDRLIRYGGPVQLSTLTRITTALRVSLTSLVIGDEVNKSWSLMPGGYAGFLPPI